jgi:hypothetical protein
VVARSRFLRWASHLVALGLVIIFGTAQAKPLGPQSSRVCRQVNGAEWVSFSETLKGKELVAFASWCSSCREKLMSTKASPDRFIFVSVFEEPEQSAQAMSRLGLTSTCIYGADLVTRLGIRALPWSKKM